MQFQPHEYQAYAIKRVEGQPNIGLFLEMGLGKTIITLTAVAHLLDDFAVGKVLVVAPKQVALTVWTQEAAKWSHTKHLRVSVMCGGSAADRRAALRAKADIYVINRENLAWLVDEVESRWPFDMVVLDELSSFKSRSSGRWKALRRVRRQIKRLVGLTGTPAPNGLLDLWAQVYLLDEGAALGRTLTAYRDRYFTPGARKGYIVYDWKPLPLAEEAIYERLEGLCLSMKSVDHLTMPERIDNVIPVQLPGEALRQYRELEREYLLRLGDIDIIGDSAAVVTGKLLQVAGGAIYDDSGEWHELHQAKLDALETVLEAANGKPVLCYYGYRHELNRIKSRFPQAEVLSTADQVRRWNAGEIPLLLAHPASAGHGLNLQSGGSTMVWFGLTWSLEQYQQANARLYRQGQKETVVIHHLVAAGTVDERVMRVLQGKASLQDELMDAVKAVMG